MGAFNEVFYRKIYAKKRQLEKNLLGGSVVLDMWAKHSGSQSLESAVARSQDRE